MLLFWIMLPVVLGKNEGDNEGLIVSPPDGTGGIVWLLRRCENNGSVASVADWFFLSTT